jgi:hypothetical protein
VGLLSMAPLGGPHSGAAWFRTVRLDRNRHLITASEQERLAALRIGVVGLSVGHAIAYTLAQEGVCGKLRESGVQSPSWAGSPRSVLLSQICASTTFPFRKKLRRSQRPTSRRIDKAVRICSTSLPRSSAGHQLIGLFHVAVGFYQHSNAQGSSPIGSASVQQTGLECTGPLGRRP